MPSCTRGCPFNDSQDVAISRDFFFHDRVMPAMVSMTTSTGFDLSTCSKRLEVYSMASSAPSS